MSGTEWLWVSIVKYWSWLVRHWAVPRTDLAGHSQWLTQVTFGLFWVSVGLILTAGLIHDNKVKPYTRHTTNAQWWRIIWIGWLLVGLVMVALSGLMCFKYIITEPRPLDFANADYFLDTATLAVKDMLALAALLSLVGLMAYLRPWPFTVGTLRHNHRLVQRRASGAFFIVAGTAALLLVGALWPFSA